MGGGVRKLCGRGGGGRGGEGREGGGGEGGGGVCTSGPP